MDQYGDPEATDTDKVARALVARLARAGFVDGDQTRLVDRGLALGLAGFGETQPL